MKKIVLIPIKADVEYDPIEVDLGGDFDTVKIKDMIPYVRDW